MQVPPIIKTLSKASDISLILKAIREKPENLIYGLTGVQKTILAALIADNQEKNMLIICDGSKRAKEIWQDLNFLLPKGEVLYFPALEIIPYEVLAQSPEIQRQRLQVMANLAQGKRTIVICSIEALGKKLIPPEIFSQSIRNLKVGNILNLEEFIKYLLDFGYERVEQVDSPGQFSLRGGIVDIFSVLYDQPIRIELFDDEIDSLRFFDIETQRSLDKVQEVNLVAAREFFLQEEALKRGVANIEEEFQIQKQRLEKKNRAALERLTNKFNEIIERVKNGLYFSGLDQMQPYFYPQQALLQDFFPEDSVFILDEPLRINETALHLEKERQESFKDLLVAGSLLPGQNQYFSELSEISKAMEKGKRVYLSLLPKKGMSGSVENMFGLETKSLPPFFSKIRFLADEIKEWKRKKYAIVVLVTSSSKGERLKQALFDCGVEAVQVGEDYNPQFGQVQIASGNLSSGAEFVKAKTVIVTENEIFQQTTKRQPRKMFHEDGQRISRLEELQVGSYVVHSSHGIGRYLGVEKLQVGDIEKDYLVIKYAGEDKLYVPTEQVNLLQRYIGHEGTVPKVHKLGGTEWHRVKTKASSSVKKLAEGLLELYAKRQSYPGFAFSPDDNWMREFEDLFPYTETPDQLKAIEEVKRDMEKSIPMDRLICGDVGYGKTEVAIRAAFKAVNDGKQVALLVPTTVLAQQHFNTFRERFNNYPVTIDVLSRFRSSKEQKNIIDKVKSGAIDIIIGTHRLLSKDIVFKDLGLLIVDEEQRFGVNHKEKLKRLKSQVDVLTLSATPIPRTLNMSLVGIRDMSVIETPPEDRYPIQTYVVEHSPNLIKDAIRRELGRGGQVFYVHNRVEDIDKIAEEVRSLVPEARVATAHGQMKETYLENIMLQFMEQEIDVLICTTIIETGLDISNANTLIINEADRLGLSQLYQLRGRVGRTNRVAYAYLTYKKEKTLSAIAEKRLHAIKEFTELGSGFKIAMRDLEIRGAGNLLGPEQHGQISAVGFDMYCKMLEEAVQELKGIAKPEEITIEIDLKVSAFIDNKYISDHGTKLDLYQRIRLAKNMEQVDDIEDELVDRFGDIPLETYNLLKIARLKVLALNSRINGIEQKGQMITLSFYQDPGLTGSQLMDLAQRFRRRLSFSADKNLKIKINIAWLGQEDIFKLLERILKEISTLVSQK